MRTYKRYVFSKFDVPRTTAYRRRRWKQERITQQSNNEYEEMQVDVETTGITDDISEDSTTAARGDRDLRCESPESSFLDELRYECVSPGTNDDSIMEEDSVEQKFWDKRQKAIRTICPCTNSSAEDVMLMCLTLGLRHNLTWAAQVDILKMINAMYGDERIPASKYMYLKLIERSREMFKYHIYCPESEKYFGDKEELPENINCSCGNVVNVCQANYFLSMDLESQFKEILSDPHVAQSIFNYRFKRHKTSIDALEDIFDGAEYKKHFRNEGILSSPSNFSYSFNTDGIPMGKSSSKTIWPIYLTINELPPKDHSKYVLIAGLYVGHKDPNQNVFLQPFVEQANKLSTKGFNWEHNGKNINSKVIPLCAVVDSVARWQMLNMSGINSYYACTFCYQKAEHTVRGQRFPPSMHKCPERTAESTKIDMKKAFDRRHHPNQKERVVKGVKGPTPLITLLYYDLIAGFVPDYMHCILLGVIRFHMGLLFESTRKKFWIDMTDNIGIGHLISAIDERFNKICALSSITHTVHSLKYMSIWKASEWRSWLIFYCVPCLKEFLKNNHLKHLALLSKATNILLQKSVTLEDIREAHRMLLRYVYLFHKYFGVTSMVLNVHLLTHIAQGVLNWGPLWTHNTFLYEGQNRHLLQLLQSPGHVVKQIALKFMAYNALPKLCNELATSMPTLEFCENILGNKLKHFIRCETAILLGKGEDCYFSLDENQCIAEYGMIAEDSSSFKRMLLRGVRYSCEDYARNKKNNDAYIITNSEKIAVIKKILCVSNEVLLFIQEVIVGRDPLLTDEHFTFDHIKEITGYGPMELIKPIDIKAQCVLIELGMNARYVCIMPFGCYGD